MKKNILLIVLGMTIMAMIIVIMNILDISNFFGIRERNEGQQSQVGERRAEMILDEDQNQLLQDSIFPYGTDGLEAFNEIQKVNAWKLLNEMSEIGFIENRIPGESGVGSAIYKLEVLGIGEIQTVETIEIIEPFPNSVATVLIMQLVTINNEIYYIEFNQTWGLSSVSRSLERLEEDVIYDSYKHEIFDGRLWNVD